jgi:Na+-transporting methylmalonyl-CoA/oxaloacetate decarboxylase gamma subunit
VEFLIVLAVLAIVVVVVSAPVRRAWRREGAEPAEPPRPPDAATEIANLEAARESKYREIRDAELDHRTGKLSDADYEAVDRALRAEAMDILHALDRVRDRHDA